MFENLTNIDDSEVKNNVSEDGTCTDVFGDEPISVPCDMYNETIKSLENFSMEEFGKSIDDLELEGAVSGLEMMSDELTNEEEIFDDPADMLIRM